jgi:hypothetical protein
VVLVVYEAEGFTGKPVAGDDLVEIGWFAPDALPDLAFGHDLRTIEVWRAQRDRGTSANPSASRCPPEKEGPLSGLTQRGVMAGKARPTQTA